MCSCEAETSAGEGDTLGPPVSPAAPAAPLLHSHYADIIPCVSPSLRPSHPSQPVSALAALLRIDEAAVFGEFLEADCIF